jgi:hypothetical protein
MEECCGTLAVEMIPGKQESTAISALIFPRERWVSLAHAQRCICLNMEQFCEPLNVEIIPGKHCDFSTYLAKRARAQSGACAEVQIPDHGTVLWAHVSRKKIQEITAISAHILPSERELSWSMRRGAVS